ncbi:hypothetical protein KY285_011003 [Solanum tuberosum]|nr:hypothetical protein KY284_011088 [Solanum tuberosum]KAH0735296.1 hypothetical protein KY285_011003 [Solanum tuberosum]
MATLSLTQFSLTLLLITSFFFSPSSAQTKCNVNSVYQLGDSLADTGNLIRIPGASIIFRADRSPYGETFFRRPTGRFSNGRLITDFISQSFKLSFLNAYLDRGASFTQGVNFAVAGATILDTSFWTARNIQLPTWNSPLSNQLNWFKRHLQSTCGSRCAENLKNSIVIMGEWGGNDYYNCFSQRKQITEVRTYVPFVVAEIMRGIKEVIQLGATRVLVPRCLRNFNDFASYHNRYVVRAIANLQREFPNVSIVYGDFYGVILSLICNPSSFGFNQNTLLSACCGTGGKHNFNSRTVCGAAGINACSNPAQYVHWDGIHLTDEAHRRITEVLVPDMLAKFNCVV